MKVYIGRINWLNACVPGDLYYGYEPYNDVYGIFDSKELAVQEVTKKCQEYLADPKCTDDDDGGIAGWDILEVPLNKPFEIEKAAVVEGVIYPHSQKWQP